eukprot:SAG31_NODE_388_length_16371_cov_5.228982_11_plen_98_part_00
MHADSNGALGTITSGYYNDGGPKHSHIKIWCSDGWIEMNFEPIAKMGTPLRWCLYADGRTNEYSPAPETPGGYTPFVQACSKSRATSGMRIQTFVFN